MEIIYATKKYTGAGGDVMVFGGTGSTGEGGAVSIVGGDTTSSGNGGDVRIESGNSGSGTDGTVDIYTSTTQQVQFHVTNGIVSTTILPVSTILPPVWSQG
eukprot:TRINITY_DN94023_c0_g1_i1.p2 TRINITY_DN94023_c0_g1~~TRINITY_DN94023_c0_g1_i1.p2  ORF type:complete len:101 (-),score=11.79 TRINITY_DN94023_c0_g1_i1:14-316(-)